MKDTARAADDHTAHKTDYSVDSAAGNWSKRSLPGFLFLAVPKYPWVCSSCRLDQMSAIDTKYGWN